MELTDNDGQLTFIDDDGKHIYKTKIKKRNSNKRLKPIVQEQNALLKNFFINDKNTDIVSAFWKWFNPIRFR